MAGKRKIVESCESLARSPGSVYRHPPENPGVCIEMTSAVSNGKEEGKKSNRFRLAKKQLCTCNTLFLHIYLSSLHHCNVKVPNFTFCRGREHTKTILFFFS